MIAAHTPSFNSLTSFFVVCFFLSSSSSFPPFVRFYSFQLSLLLPLATAFLPPPSLSAFTRLSPPSTSSPLPSTSLSATAYDQEQFIADSKEMRLKHLEEQAMYALKISCENYDNAVFPNAMIAGDVVITHLLGRLGYLKSGQAKIMVVDTFHLFDETVPFLNSLEKEYGFKAEVFCAEGIAVGDKAGFDKRYGANLWKEDIEQYDKVCKVSKKLKSTRRQLAGCVEAVRNSFTMPSLFSLTDLPLFLSVFLPSFCS